MQDGPLLSGEMNWLLWERCQLILEQPEDSENEVALLPNSKLVVIDSVWGHQAGGGASSEDNTFLEREIGKFIVEPL